VPIFTAMTPIPEPTVLPNPIAAWALLDLRDDGEAEAVGDQEYAIDWSRAIQQAPPCDHAAHVPTSDDGYVAWHAREVPARHDAPVPFCTCGLRARNDLHGRRFDHWRDRVGFRMRAPAAVVVWGRVLLGPRVLRAEYGHVAALGVLADEPPPRRARVERAAKRLEAEIVVVDESRSGCDPLLAAASRSGEPLSYRAWRRMALSRQGRKWQAGRDHSQIKLALAGTRAAVLPAIALASAAHALGASQPVTTASYIVTGTAVLGGGMGDWWLRNREIEVLAPAPAQFAAKTPPSVALEVRPDRWRPGPLPVGRCGTDADARPRRERARTSRPQPR
jgi:hypothetical protein